MSIYSGVADNWMRVEMLNALANEYYVKTKDSEYRKLRLNPTNKFYFDLEASTLMDKEACLVGMVMVWSAVTLEALVNHVIAEIVKNESDAIDAIEFPQNLHYTKAARSSLAKKLIVLGRNDKVSDLLLKNADHISDLRNAIVHDKPFQLIDYGDGEIEVRHYKNRGDSNSNIYRYEQLEEFYNLCQGICDFIDQYHVHYSQMGDRVVFNKLSNS